MSVAPDSVLRALIIAVGLAVYSFALATIVVVEVGWGAGISVLAAMSVFSAAICWGWIA